MLSRLANRMGPSSRNSRRFVVGKRIVWSTQTRYESLEQRLLLATLVFTSKPMITTSGDAVQGDSTHNTLDYGTLNPTIISDGSSTAQYQVSLAAGYGPYGATARWDISDGTFTVTGPLAIMIQADKGEKIGDPVSISLTYDFNALGGTGPGATPNGENRITYSSSSALHGTTTPLFQDMIVETGSNSPTSNFIAWTRNTTTKTISFDAKIGDTLSIDLSINGHAHTWQGGSTGVARGALNANVSYTATVTNQAPKPDIEATSLNWNNGQVTLNYTIKDADLPNPTDISFFWASGNSRGTIISPAAHGMTAVTKGPQQFVISSSGFPAPPRDTYYLIAFINQTKAVSLLFGDALIAVDLASALKPATVKLDLSPAAPERGTPYSVKVEVTNNALVPLDFVRDTSEVLDTPDSLRAVTPGQINVKGVPLGTVGVGQTIVFDVGTFTRTWDWIDPKNPITDQVKFEEKLTEKTVKAAYKATASEIEKNIYTPLNNLKKLWDTISDIFKPQYTASLRYVIDVKPDLSGPQADQVSENAVGLVVPGVKKAEYAAYIAAKFTASEFLGDAVAATIAGALDPTHFTLSAVIPSLVACAASMQVAATKYDAAVDPPDANYKTLATPQPIDVPELDALPSSPAKDAALVSLQIQSLIAAAATANNRASGALLAGDAGWQSAQLVSAAGFTNQAAALQARLATMEAGIAPSLASNVAAHASEVSTYISQHGLPASGQNIFAEMGFSPAQIANIRTYFAALEPEAFDDPTLTISTLEVSSTVLNTIASGYLSQATQINTNSLGQKVRDLTAKERQQLDAERATIQADLGGEIASDAFLTRINQYLSDVGGLSIATNNAAAFQPYLDFGRAALAGYQKIGVASFDQSPKLTLVPNQNVNVGSPLTLTIHATGQGSGKVVSYSLDSGAPAGAKINQNTGAFAWTPTVPGTFSLTVRVTDNNSPPLGDAQTFTITANDVAPTVTLGSNVSIGQGTVFSRSGSFSSSIPGTFKAAVDYGDGTGLQPLALSPSRTFTLSHAYSRPGTFAVTVDVTDSFGMVGRQTLSVSVAPAPLASGFGVGRDAFVTTLYNENLGRSPEPRGLRFWSGHLFTGSKPKTLTRAIWSSKEHRALVKHHLFPPITFLRSYADALHAGQLVARPHFSSPAGPLALLVTKRRF